MNRRKLTAAVAAVAAVANLTASGGINRPDAQGYVDRARAMYHNANYNGCLDQMLEVRNLSPTQAQAEDALYYTAMSTLGLGDDEALGLLKSFLARFPESPRCQDVLMSIGDFYFTRGSYGDAVAAYLNTDPRALDADRAEDWRYRLAYSYMMLAEYDRAEAMMRTLQGNARYGNAARFYEAYIAYSRQEYPRALQLFKNVDTTQEPGSAADYYLAQLYFLKGEYQPAYAAARRMIDSPTPVAEFLPEAKRIAGEALYNMGDTKGCMPYLWEYAATAEDPQPSAFYILGVSEYNQGHYDAAAKLLQRAVRADNAMGQNAYLYLGQCYLKLGNNNSALMAFENAYRMNYDPKVQETAFYNYAVARSEGGHAPFSSSVAIFEDFLSQYPNSRHASAIAQYLISGYMAGDDYEAALTSINKVKNPSAEVLDAKQRVLLVLGARDYDKGNIEQAINRLDQAMTTGSDASLARQAQLWKGDCLFALEDWAGAAKCYNAYLERAQADDANLQLAYYDLGYALYNQQKYPEALAALRKATDSSGALSSTALADAHNRMADCLLAARDFNGAATHYRQAADLNPASADYSLYRQAVVCGLQGDNKRKLQLLDTMIDRYPSSGLVPAALLAQAETYTAMGSTAKAVNSYTRLTREYPQSSYGRNGQLQLALTYLNSGDRVRAIEAYRKVIYTYPSSDEARVASEDLRRIYAEDGKLPDYLEFMSSVPNAPEVDPSEVEATAFDVAEEWYLADKGTAKLQSYVKEYPSGANIATALYYLAEDAEDNGKYDEAYRYASRVVTTYPDAQVAEQALAVKASCELHEGKGELALESYRKLEQKASTPAMLHEARMQIMRVARDLGRHTEVLTVSEKLLGSSATGAPELDEIHFTHAYALYRMGRHDEAVAEWKQLAANPEKLFGAKSAFYTGQSQFERGNLAAAQRTVEKFLDSASSQDYWRARAVILLADILAKQGNDFEADQYLRSLRSNYTDAATRTEIVSMVDARLKKK